MSEAQELIARHEATAGWERVSWHDLFSRDQLVNGPHVTDSGRWETYHEAVWKMSDGSLVEGTWSEPATEYQDCEPTLELWEVEAYTEPVTKYRRVAP